MASKYPNTGVLFKNDRKTKDTHPDFTGNGEIHGIDTWISGWTKKPKEEGKKAFISLTFKSKDEATGEIKTSTVNVPMDDDVPF